MKNYLKGVSPLLALLILYSLFIGGCRSISAARGWSDLKTLSSNNSNVLGYSLQIDSLGNPHIGWAEYSNGTVTIYYIKTLAAEDRRLEKITVCKLNNFNANYLMDYLFYMGIDKNNNANFVWADIEGNVIYSNKPGDVWQNHTILLPEPKNRVFALSDLNFVIDKMGQIHIVWSNNDDEFYYNTSSDGVNWNKSINISKQFPGQEEKTVPPIRIAIDDKNIAYILWIVKSKLYCSLIENGKIKPVYVEIPEDVRELSNVIVNDDKLHIAAFARSGSDEIIHLYFDLTQHEWVRHTAYRSPPALIKNILLDEEMWTNTVVNIAIDDENNPHLIWVINHGCGRDADICYTFFNGQKWSGRQRIIKYSTPGIPQIAIDKNNILHIVWPDIENHLLYYSSHSIPKVEDYQPK